MEKENIIKLRDLLIRKLMEYKERGGKEHIYLDIDKELLHDILFENKEIDIPNDLWKLLDLSGVSLMVSRLKK